MIAGEEGDLPRLMSESIEVIATVTSTALAGMFVVVVTLANQREPGTPESGVNVRSGALRELITLITGKTPQLSRGCRDLANATRDKDNDDHRNHNSGATTTLCGIEEDLNCRLVRVGVQGALEISQTKNIGPAD